MLILKMMEIIYSNNNDIIKILKRAIVAPEIVPG